MKEAAVLHSTFTFMSVLQIDTKNSKLPLFRHSEHVLQEQARRLGHNRPLKNIYCIGDNVCTDIFGANLYNRYLLDNRLQREETRGGGDKGDLKESPPNVAANVSGSAAILTSRSIDHLLGSNASSAWVGGAENCYSVLVETGVYSQDSRDTISLDHSPRDFLPVEDGYQEPTHVTTNVLEAVDLIFKKEGFS